MRNASGHLPFNLRLLLAFSVPLIVWVLVTLASVLALREARQAWEPLTRSQHVLVLATDYRDVLDDLREDERSYLITSASRDMDQHREALERANKLYERIARLSQNDAAQLERLDRAHDNLQRWYYDVSMPRLRARTQLPYSYVRTAQLAGEQLLGLLAAEPDSPERAGHATRLRGLLEVLQESDADIVSPRVFEQALQQLDAVTRAPGGAGAELRTLAGTLQPALARIADAAHFINSTIENGDGPELVQQFTDAVNNFIAAEQQHVEEYREQVQMAAAAVRWTIWTGVALGIVAMLIVMFWFTRRVGRSVESIDYATHELVRGNLTARAGVDGRTDRLTDRFNRVADLVERRHRETELLSQLGEALHNSRDIGEALHVFGQFAVKLFPGRAGVLYLIESNKVDVSAVASWHGGEKFSEQEMTTDDCWGLRLGHIHENGSGGTLRCAHMSRPADSLCVPLPAFGEIIGMLFVAFCEDTDDANREQQRRFVDVLAEQVALALANVKLRETLRSQSIRDPLTALYNRRHLDETIERELRRAERHAEPLSVLAFDIDHFKRFNDEHGHDGGDAVLKCIGDTLRDFFRPEDAAFRIGGEEFIALLPGMALEDALVRAEALRHRIAHTRVMQGNVPLPSVTVSIGVATYPLHGTNAEALLKAADTAQYAAKNAGRNRVLPADEP